MLMEKNIWASLQVVKNMVKVYLHLAKLANMKVNGLVIKPMDLEKFCMIMMIAMKVNLSTDKDVVKVYIFILMEQSLRENLMVTKKYKELLCIQMEINSLDNLEMMREVEKEHIFIHLEKYMKGNLLMDSDMDMAPCNS